jgi:hypothetical protein
MIASAVLLGCGNKEDAIPFIGPQGSKPAPKGLEQGMNYYYSNITAKSAYLNTSSSRAIRRETIGLNLDVRYKDKNQSKADVVATVSFTEGAESCSQAIYRSDNIDAAKFKDSRYSFKIEGFAEARCLQFNEDTNKCEYLYLTITQTPSSIVSNSQSGNGLVRATVPVLMENIAHRNGADAYIPTIAEDSQFLQVPEHKNDFQYCLQPTRIIQAESDVIFIIDPTSFYQDSEDHSTRPYNYTGNGFF